MKNQKISIQKALALSFGFFLFLGTNACKERTLGDTDLVPGVDNINTFELTQMDLDAKLSVNILDSFVSGNPDVPVGALGQVKDDPFYGEVASSLYLQFTIPNNSFALPDSIFSYDSIVLTLPYSNVKYGDSVGKLALNVYEINDAAFKVDTSSKKLYSFLDFTTYATPIGTYDGNPQDWKNDSVAYPGIDTVSNQLRIKLSAATLSKFAGMTASALHNNTSFVNFFNGVKIEVPNGMSSEYYKAIYYFLLQGSSTAVTDDARLELYFSKGAAGATKGVLQFPFNNKYSAFLSHLDRDYTGKPAQSYATTGVAMDSFLVTGAPGFQTAITIDNLDKIPAGSMIYLARLELNVLKEFSSYIYANPSLLMLNIVNDDSTVSPIADYIITANPDVSYQLIQVEQAKQFVGGTPLDKVIGSSDYQTYTLNFPRTIQKAVMEGKKKITLRLFPYYQLPGAYRMVAPGLYGAGADKAKISIIYTKP